MDIGKALPSLGRPEAEFDFSGLARHFADKRVLITGAAGSVGSSLSLRLARMGCAHLAMLDHFDHGLLDVLEGVRKIAPKLPVTDALCDIRDRGRLQTWLGRIQPDVVIHAAALKHVHVGERHPAECVLTNLVGARNALAAAASAGAQDFMLVSSDKAASPVCVMGATKRLAELHLIGFERERGHSMRLKSVRFGNVYGSQGSVAPRFAAQIEAGGPLEVTDPNMQRFFMSPMEAVGLILSVTALDDADAKKVGAYCMEMGDPVSILQLGQEMIARSNRPDTQIRYTGLRPGEKLKEELYDGYEVADASALPNVFRITPLSPDAYVTSADIARLESIARTMEDVIVRERIFEQLDACLGRSDAAAG